MLPKTGKGFPIGRNKLTDTEFAEVIASALSIEFGEAKHAAKIVTRWTGASLRTARNWLSGSHAPSGVNLVLLARQSDAVLNAVLILAGRRTQALETNLKALRKSLADVVETIDAAIDLERVR